MSDDLDDLLRRSMKTLDDQVPSGYFDGLPTRTLARLEDSTMQTTGSSSSSKASPVAPPPPAKERDEDSGLHDIRSLASSTKLRLSSRRSTQNPIVHEDDVLASSSAGWKAVALPEPAKMVSLPELADLPTKAEIEALDKAAQKKAKKRADKIDVASAPAAIEASTPAVATAAPAIGSRIAAQSSGGRGKMIAIIGLGLSAAAASVFYFVVNNKDESKSAVSYESKAGAPLPEMTAKQLPPPTPAAAVEPPAVVAAAPVEPAPVPEPVVPDKAASKADKPAKVHKVEIRDTSMTKDKPADKPVVAPKEEIKKPAGDDGEPSFDALLKEAGVNDQKKDAKPKLDKKSLSGGDIKTGMGSVAGKAGKCYAGTQGTASVKLTVAPSGQVQKVTVTGVFAGTPVAACVESAVKSASFPAWDGGQQTISYSFLLAE
ncbi:MAG: hypothetical protein H0T42_17455 [Deltaproteobacteria bacterium]|nr:hypothetical protein [Deltaproteobacteria bacterium]